jgi:hypothetical protein
MNLRQTINPFHQVAHAPLDGDRFLWRHVPVMQMQARHHGKARRTNKPMLIWFTI